MYSELTERVLVGGFVSPQVDPDFLIRAGVTHLVNASDKPLPAIVSNQFWTLEMDHATWDGAQKLEYWKALFSFVSNALRRRENKLYFHVTPEIPVRPVAPVAVYAGLRVLGHGMIDSRRRVERLHPVLSWHEISMKSVDKSLEQWAQHHRIPKVRPLRHSCSNGVRHTATASLVEILDEILQ